MACEIVIPGTFWLCGEAGHYCSDTCWAYALSKENAALRVVLSDVLAVVNLNADSKVDIANLASHLAELLTPN